MTETGKPATEIELKLALSAAGQRDLADHAAFQPPCATPPERRHEVTTYFDTADQALHRLGLSLRVRRAQGGRVQTVKALGADGVMAARGEWEWPVGQDTPDLGLAAGTPLAERLLPLAGQLHPILVTDIDRTVRTLRLEGGTVVEAALDRGSIAAGGSREPVRELELELREGGPGPLFRLALELHAAAPLTIAVESKAARGYRLKTGTAPKARKAASPGLEPDVGAAEGFRRIVAAGLGHLLANQPAALFGDAEGVHQMRVAIRQLRAALGLFAPHLERHATARFQTELRRIGQVFGEARDWDVFCLEILPGRLHGAKGAGWRETLREPAAARRRLAHARLARELGAAEFTALVLGIAAWVEDSRTQPRLLGDAHLDRPLSHLAPALLERLARKVDRRGRHIGERSADELHALRKSFKKLRYAVEYVAALYRRKPVKSYLGGCRNLQQALGAINDTAIATGLARQLTEGGGAALAPAVAALGRHLARRRRNALEGLADKWDAFTREPRFWG